MPDRPVLIPSPRDDHAFQEHAEQLVSNGVTAANALQTGLRKRYPKAVVRARDLAGEQAVIYYVYRDGHWTRSADPKGG